MDWVKQLPPCRSDSTIDAELRPDRVNRLSQDTGEPESQPTRSCLRAVYEHPGWLRCAPALGRVRDAGQIFVLNGPLLAGAK